jgi:amidase
VAVELAFQGAVEIGKAILNRSVSSETVTNSTLQRIERLEPSLHAFATLTAKSALADARRADREIAAGKRRGPLHGVPVAVKDLCDVKGTPTGAGIPMFQQNPVAVADCTVVARLRKAGAVIVGKTQLTEGAMSVHHPDVTPPVNPWRADLWPGVSSSGSGVAVAAGLAFGALGSDTGGSIRFPAQANGLVGMKPTWGRVSRQGVFALAATLDHVGPMTRRVEDSAAMLGAIAGLDGGDPTSADVDVPDYLKGISRGIKGLSVGYDAAYCEADADPAIVRAVKAQLAVLKAAGAVVKAVKMPPVAEALESWRIMCAVEAAIAHSQHFPARREIYGPFFARMLDIGLGAPATQYAHYAVVRRALRAGMDSMFRSVDLMIMPVMPMPAGTIEDRETRLAKPDPTFAAMRFTAPFDISGHPTLTLPTGKRAKDGSLIGFQLAAGSFQEALLFRAGMAWQVAAALPRDVPPLAA